MKLGSAPARSSALAHSSRPLHTTVIETHEHRKARFQALLTSWLPSAVLQEANTLAFLRNGTHHTVGCPACSFKLVQQ
jgi:hypothetical protein